MQSVGIDTGRTSGVEVGVGVGVAVDGAAGSGVVVAAFVAVGRDAGSFVASAGPVVDVQPTSSAATAPAVARCARTVVLPSGLVIVVHPFVGPFVGQGLHGPQDEARCTAARARRSSG
ncbi:hypothetical protein ASG28_08650 [Frigoribacterium sp. Leaf415]|nr:hypothetical protein ASF07_08645 [Frigoribacterium sp. Leaf254]KQT39645.1 hypothetical protein ASG28_08650 [Frigoribacterium sp. Leaf415]